MRNALCDSSSPSLKSLQSWIQRIVSLATLCAVDDIREEDAGNPLAVNQTLDLLDDLLLANATAPELDGYPSKSTTLADAEIDG
jgi:hypothetical protein